MHILSDSGREPSFESRLGAFSGSMFKNEFIAISFDSLFLRRRFDPKCNGESGERNFSSSPSPSSGMRIGGNFLDKKDLALHSFFRSGRGGTGGGVSQGNLL